VGELAPWRPRSGQRRRLLPPGRTTFRVPHAGQRTQDRSIHPVSRKRVRQSPHVTSQRDPRIAQRKDQNESTRTGLMPSSVSSPMVCCMSCAAPRRQPPVGHVWASSDSLGSVSATEPDPDLSGGWSGTAAAAQPPSSSGSSHSCVSLVQLELPRCLLRSLATASANRWTIDASTGSRRFGPGKY